jgi:hypothetical protein
MRQAKKWKAARAVGNLIVAGQASEAGGAKQMETARPRYLSRAT